MKETIYNYDYLTDNDITEVVVRTKALIIKNENILVGNENGLFQFPGGHLEKKESITDCLKREVLEETGIELDDEEIKRPFYKVTFLSKDWPEKGKNRKAEIYYYIVETNKDVNLLKTKYTEHEKQGNFKIESFKLADAINKIKENIPNNEKNKIISPDMIGAIEEYIKQNKD